MAGNDSVISNHIFLGHPDATICPPRTYNVQVRSATTLGDERINIFLESLQVPEDEISDTPPLLIKRICLFSKDHTSYNLRLHRK